MASTNSTALPGATVIVCSSLGQVAGSSFARGLDGRLGLQARPATNGVLRRGGRQHIRLLIGSAKDEKCNAECADHRQAARSSGLTAASDRTATVSGSGLSAAT